MAKKKPNVYHESTSINEKKTSLNCAKNEQFTWAHTTHTPIPIHTLEC